MLSRVRRIVLYYFFLQFWHRGHIVNSKSCSCLCNCSIISSIVCDSQHARCNEATPIEKIVVGVTNHRVVWFGVVAASGAVIVDWVMLHCRWGVIVVFVSGIDRNHIWITVVDRVEWVIILKAGHSFPRSPISSPALPAPPLPSVLPTLVPTLTPPNFLTQPTTATLGSLLGHAMQTGVEFGKVLGIGANFWVLRQLEVLTHEEEGRVSVVHWVCHHFLRELSWLHRFVYFVLLWFLIERELLVWLIGTWRVGHRIAQIIFILLYLTSFLFIRWTAGPLTYLIIDDTWRAAGHIRGMKEG